MRIRAETSQQAGLRLSRMLLLARLVPPGTPAFLDREGRLFEELLKTGWIADKVRRLGLRLQGEDIEQMVHIRLIQDFRSGRLHSVSKGYIETSVEFQAKTWWRKKAPQQLLEATELPLNLAAGASEAEYIALENKIHAAWAMLPEPHQRLVAARFLHVLAKEDSPRLTLQALADEWGTNPTSVHRMEKKSVDLFVESLKEVGLEEFADMFKRFA